MLNGVLNHSALLVKLKYEQPAELFLVVSDIASKELADLVHGTGRCGGFVRGAAAVAGSPADDQFLVAIAGPYGAVRGGVGVPDAVADHAFAEDVEFDVTWAGNVSKPRHFSGNEAE